MIVIKIVAATRGCHDTFLRTRQLVLVVGIREIIGNENIA